MQQISALLALAASLFPLPMQEPGNVMTEELQQRLTLRVDPGHLTVPLAITDFGATGPMTVGARDHRSAQVEWSLSASFSPDDSSAAPVTVTPSCTLLNETDDTVVVATPSDERAFGVCWSDPGANHRSNSAVAVDLEFSEPVDGIVVFVLC